MVACQCGRRHGRQAAGQPGAWDPVWVSTGRGRSPIPRHGACVVVTDQQRADDDHVALLDVRRHLPKHGEHADDCKVVQAEREREPVKRPVVADQQLAASTGRPSRGRSSSSTAAARQSPSVRALARSASRPRLLEDDAANAAKDQGHRADQPGQEDLPRRAPRVGPDVRVGLADEPRARAVQARSRPS